MKKWIKWIVLLLVVIGGGIGAYLYQKAHAAPDISYKTAPVEKRKITAKITASGNIQATVTVTIGAQVSGRISKLMVDFNSTVKKGDLVAKIDPQLPQAAVEQSNANYLQAKAGVTKAKAQQQDAELSAARAKSLFEGSLASAADLQTANTALSVAKAATEVAVASLSQASASLHQAQVNLSYCDIFSPIDGTVISRSVDVGQTVAASLQAPVLFTIAEDLRKMQVHASVAEGDVGRLQAEMDATFTVDAFPGQTFKGKVSQIRNAATTVSNVVTYDAVIDVDNTDLRLRPGMTATVTIIYAERDDVLAIPNAAVRFKPPAEAAASFGSAASSHSGNRPPGSGSAWAGASGSAGHRSRPAPGASGGPPVDGAPERRTIYVLRNGSPVATRILTGLSDGSMTELLKTELVAGDEVITDVVIAGKAATTGQGGQPGGGGAPRMGRMF